MNRDVYHEEIADAIRAHSAWKQRLNNAAEHGEAGIPVADISRDDHCRLGRWLKSVPLSEGGDHVEEVRRLHTQFHSVAGKIAGMIRSGQGMQASAALDGSEYLNVSTALVMALGSWRADL